MQEWQEKIEQEFEQFKAEVREEVKHLKEQRTDEMKAINVNVASADVLNQLKTLEKGQQGISQKQDKISADVDELKIDAKAYTSDAAIFKNKVERIESDVSTIKTDVEQVKTVQKGHSKFFEEHGKRLAATATKEDIVPMATKEDLSNLEARMDNKLTAMEERLVDTIKQLWQQRPS